MSEDFLEMLRRMLLKARFDQDAVQVKLISSFMSDCQRTFDKDFVTQEQGIKLASAQLKAVHKSVAEAERAGVVYMPDMDYVTFLESFIPVQLTEEQLKVQIMYCIAEENKPTLGSIMKQLNSRFNGQFDGKLASQLARELLNK